MREADNLNTFMCRMSWKSGSLNLLEPSGPHRACNGTALPLSLRGDFIPFMFSEQTATFALYNINNSVFITDVESVYIAVRTESLYKTDTFGFYNRGGECLQRGTD